MSTPSISIVVNIEPGFPARRIAELLPWNWQAAGATRAAA
jgi:hypothetical protein